MIAARMIGFMRHLRLNGFVAGPAETEAALSALRRIDLRNREHVRVSLKTLLTGRRDHWLRFDDLFEAYWRKHGRQRAAVLPQSTPDRTAVPRIWADHLRPGQTADHGQSQSASPGESRLAGSPQVSLARTDLRHIADPVQMAEAERLAYRLARAMAYRLSRRLRLDTAGARLDLRRTIRRSIPHGGEPIDLAWRDRPDRPVNIVVLLDVSGSMQPYVRFHLQFLRGLLAVWRETDAYLFHTRLIRITDAARGRDPQAAMTRIGLMAEGFGGGTRLGGSLKAFNDAYAKRALNSRSVVFIVSDGYDTGEPREMARQLERLKRRARRLVWLNPLLGWRDYRPITRAMTAALPFIDRFAAAHTLEALAAIEGDLRKL